MPVSLKLHPVSPSGSFGLDWVHTPEFPVKANLETSKHLHVKKQVYGCGKTKTIGLMLGAQMAHELQDTRLTKKCPF